VITFANVNGSPGQCGDSTHVCQVTTNAKGLTTAQTAVSIAASGGGITQLHGDATAGPGSGNQMITLANANGSPGTCGDATHVCQVTTNAKGLTTTQTQIAITAAGGITQLTGDVSAGPGTGSQTTTLATVNTGPGTCGDGTHVCQITTNNKGLTTAQSQVAITAAGITQLTGDGTAGPGTGSQGFTLSTVNSNVGTCGDATHVSQITLDAKGRATACVPVSIIASGAVSSINSIVGAVLLVGDNTITVAPSGQNIQLHVLGNSRVSYDILTGAPANPAAVLRNAVVSGTISSCQFVTTTSDNSVNLTFNLNLNGSSIFSGGGQTIAAGTSTGTTISLALTGSIGVVAGQQWVLSISAGTVNWTGNLSCH
jgi:hypothetical protein